MTTFILGLAIGAAPFVGAIIVWRCTAPSECEPMDADVAERFRRSEGGLL